MKERGRPRKYVLEGTYTCTMCNQEKPGVEFYAGSRSYCRSCHALRKANPEKYAKEVLPEPLKRCARCGEVKNKYEDFYSTPGWCKQCRKEYAARGAKKVEL